jgi:hypothetical protein
VRISCDIIARNSLLAVLACSASLIVFLSSNLKASIETIIKAAPRKTLLIVTLLKKSTPKFSISASRVWGTGTTGSVFVFML